jgi:Fe-S-cluster-containing dehydrogenase component
MSVQFKDFFIDFQRCIGCNACVAACAECHTHRGTPMIHVEKAEPGISPQTVPMVCMHCKEPTCALSCPADAIKMDENGIVHSSLKPRCIACRNCELSCPFGVPFIREDIQQMQKCDMCFDRTSIGKKPMCATVCPTGALFYGSIEQIERLRPHSKPINKWQFGKQLVETRVWVMVPKDVEVMVVDWPELLQGASGPVELAMKLKERFEAEGTPVPRYEASLPMFLQEESAKEEELEEAQFL